MRPAYKLMGKWLVRIGLVLLVLVVLDVLAVAAPFPLFSHTARFDEFTVYSNEPLPEGLGQVIENVRSRIRAMEHARPGERCRVFICGDTRLYSFFAFLTRRTPDSMGIGLSVFGNVYLNGPKIRRVAEENRAGIRHSRFEGDLSEVISHEIAHFNVVKQLGYRAAMRMPFWKSEGYAEYQANLAATRADSAYDFTDRIDLLLDDDVWGVGNSPARRLFEWHLLVEFLAEVKGAGLLELIDETVTEATVHGEMLVWYDGRRAIR